MVKIDEVSAGVAEKSGIKEKKQPIRSVTKKRNNCLVVVDFFISNSVSMICPPSGMVTRYTYFLPYESVHLVDKYSVFIRKNCRDKAGSGFFELRKRIKVS